jgi:hypothetical protein
MGFLRRDFHCRSQRRRRNWNTFARPLLQIRQLPAQGRNSIIEFGGFAAAASVRNCREDDGWQAHHHPADEE